MRKRELVFNQTLRTEMDLRRTIMQDALGSFGRNSLVTPDAHFDYGCNTFIGNDFFSNVHLVVLDEAEVRIGDGVFIGPNVTICTATHPTDPKKRTAEYNEDGTLKMIEYAKPVTIGENVWIGAGVIINPGIHIGSGTVIGAGSVVTHDIPENVVAVGVPCKVSHEI